MGSNLTCEKLYYGVQVFVFGKDFHLEAVLPPFSLSICHVVMGPDAKDLSIFIFIFIFSKVAKTLFFFIFYFFQ